MSTSTDVLTAGFELIALGYPVALAFAKQPINGVVKGRTTDTGRLARLYEANPGAQLGVATGPPGPTVLDIDRILECWFFDQLEKLGVPRVKTGREGGGHHFYFRGDDRLPSGNIPGGEIRSVNSFAVCPPSIHDKTGQLYEWVVPPVAELQPVPGFVLEALAEVQALGAEAFIVDGKVTEGNRHPFLKARLLTEASHGVVTIKRLAEVGQMLNDEVCEPPVKKHEIHDLAKWVSESRVAKDAKASGGNGRIRKRTEHPKVDQMAPAQAQEWLDQLVFGRPLTDTVVRYGQGEDDALDWRLTNGKRIRFTRQVQAAKRATLARVVASYTEGEFNPVLGDVEAMLVYGALCRLANLSALEEEEIDNATIVREHVLQCGDPLEGWTLETPEGRWEALGKLSECTLYTAKDHMTRRHKDGTELPGLRPTAIRDSLSGLLYVRASELLQTSVRLGMGLSQVTLHGRMAMLGVIRHRFRSVTPREAGPRHYREAVLYEIPPTVAEG